MIYLDHNATTPLDPRVLEAMLPFLKDRYGNASSRDHAFGWDARDAVEEARFQIAEIIHAHPREIFFTSGATESLALAIHGLFPAGAPAPAGGAATGGLVTSAVEHDAALAPCLQLQRRGLAVAYLPVDALGRLAVEDLARACESQRPKLVSLMAANNETGVLFPFRECAAAAHAQGALFLLDAAQALGKLPLDAEADGFDLAVFSAHKLGGPKGIGALFVRGGREAVELEPLFSGGGQEAGLRGGTLDVPAIVGFGAACQLAAWEMQGETSRLRGLRDRLEAGLRARFPEIRVNGDAPNRLPNTSNLLFPGVDARACIRAMHDVAVSTRSACGSASTGPSHVLKAMGLSDDEAFASLRFSLGRANSESEIDLAVAKAADAYGSLRREGA